MPPREADLQAMIEISAKERAAASAAPVRQAARLNAEGDSVAGSVGRCRHM
ncbi:MAG: hypothetical protein KDJ63_13030 [Nitratireductor sp.]|nr:hypothetical protein [Nitratireductor sp.]